VYVLLSTLNRFLINGYYTTIQIIICTGIYFVTLSCCYTEVSTAFFWFSSAISYQLPVALFYAGFGFSIRSAYAKSSSKKFLYSLATVLCIIAITGANEMVALSLGALMLITGFVIFKFHPNQRKRFCVYLLIYLVSFIVLAISPGSRERSAGIPEAGLLKAVVFAFTRTVYTFWNIFKEPLFWLSGLFIFSQFQAISTRFRIANFPVFKFFSKYRRWLLVVPPLIVFVNYLPLVYLSNGSLPERATNSAIFITLLSLSALIPISGVLYSEKVILPEVTRYFLIAGIGFTILCNRLFFSMLQNLVSGYFYDKVMTIRETELSDASKRLDKKVILLNYDACLQQQVKNFFPAGTRKQIEGLITRKPEHLVLFDDLSSEYNLTFLKEYYKLDSITIIEKQKR
jgi:hypothetical protein